jgi:hypothetical protein
MYIGNHVLLHVTESYKHFTIATFSYFNSGYIPLGFITSRHFFVPAIYISALLHFNMKSIGGDKSIVNNYHDLFLEIMLWYAKFLYFIAEHFHHVVIPFCSV